MDIGGYYSGGYSINGYWWLLEWRLFYQWLLVVIRVSVILLVAIGGYYSGGYSINGYWWLLMVILSMAFDGYYINCYWWLFYWWLFY